MSQAQQKSGDKQTIELLVEALKQWYESKKEELKEVMETYGLSEVLGALKEFEDIMDDLWHLVRRSTYHFKFVFDRSMTRDGEWRVDVIGNATKFTAYVKPDTPLEKVIEAVLDNPENLRATLSQAFATLEGVASNLKGLLNFAKELKELEEKIDRVAEVLEAVKEVCRKSGNDNE